MKRDQKKMRMTKKNYKPVLYLIVNITIGLFAVYGADAFFHDLQEGFACHQR